MARLADYEAQMRKLTATDFNWGSHHSGGGVKKKQKSPLTIPDDIVLATQNRSNYRKKVLDPMRKARQQERVRAEAEAHKKKKEEETKKVKDLRKSLVHHPLPLPRFDRPFRPKYGGFTPTIPREPSLTPDKHYSSQSGTPNLRSQSSGSATSGSPLPPHNKFGQSSHKYY